MSVSSCMHTAHETREYLRAQTANSSDETLFSLVEYIKSHVIIFSLLICVINCMQFAQYFSALPERCSGTFVTGSVSLRYDRHICVKQAKLILYSNDENDAMKQRANINHHVQNSSYK